MKAQLMYVSAMFASRNSRLASESRTGELLDLVAACCSPHRMLSFFTETISGGLSRSKVLEGYGQLERTWLRRNIAEMHLASHAAGHRSNLEAFAWASLRRHPLPYERTTSQNYLQQVTVHRSLTTSETEAFINSLRALFKLLDAPCGYLHVSTDQGLALSEIGFQRIMGQRPPENTPDDRANWGEYRESIIYYKHPEDTNDRVDELN